MAERALCLDLRGPPGGVRLLLCLSPPTPPASVLGGFMTGTTIIGPDPQPSVTRIVMIRLPAADPRPDPPGAAYLPPGASLAADLRAAGLPVAAPDAVDAALVAFLCGGEGGLDQIPGEAYRALVELFDRWWLEGTTEETAGPALTAHAPHAP